MTTKRVMIVCDECNLFMGELILDSRHENIKYDTCHECELKKKERDYERHGDES
jgi:hypothetical protein